LNYAFILIIGASIGSFAYAFALRFPLGKKWAIDRSRCPSCQKTLSWKELIPIVSFVAQRGRCKNCKIFIGWSYLVSELLMALIFLLMWINFSSIQPISLFFWLTVLAVFFIIAISDLKHFIIPDKVLIFGAVVTTLARIFLIEGFYPLTTNLDSRLGLLIEGLIVGLTLGLVFFAIWFLSKGKWIGFGDVKLVGFIGFLFGFPGALWVFYIAVIFGVVVSIYLFMHKKANRKTPLPFGTFLSLSSILYIIFAPSINSIFSSILLQ